jgi:hypothetical protein
MLAAFMNKADKLSSEMSATLSKSPREPAGGGGAGAGGGEAGGGWGGAKPEAFAHGVGGPFDDAALLVDVSYERERAGERSERKEGAAASAPSASLLGSRRERKASLQGSLAQSVITGLARAKRHYWARSRKGAKRHNWARKGLAATRRSRARSGLAATCRSCARSSRRGLARAVVFQPKYPLSSPPSPLTLLFSCARLAQVRPHGPDLHAGAPGRPRRHHGRRRPVPAALGRRQGACAACVQQKSLFQQPPRLV